jgi:zinc protease
LLACSLALALAVRTAAAPAGAFPYPIHRHTLGNGLQVVLVPYDTPGLAAYFTAFRVGSRDDVEPGRSGLAHLFEHLAYRGTLAHPGEDWDRTTKALGLDTNAFTDDDVTAYWLFGPASALPQVIALEGDRFANLDYTGEDFKVEVRAVMAEQARAAASPDHRVQAAGRRLAFERHPYQHGPTGLEDDARGLEDAYRQSRDLYRRLYRPEQASVVVVGDFDEQTVLALVERHYGPWLRGGGAPPAVPAEPPQRREKAARVAWPGPVQPRLWSGWHTPGAADLDATAAQLVLWPLLFGRPFPLHRELVEERNLASEVGGEFQPHRDPFLFGYELVLTGPGAEAPAREAVDRAVAAVAAGRVDARDLAEVKANVRNTLLMQTDTPYRAGVWLVYYGALTGDPGYLDAVLERVGRVSGDDLARFARRWLVPENRTTVVLAAAR